jgi:hypothetical protein
MSLIFFLRPAKSSDDTPTAVDPGGHFLPEKGKKFQNLIIFKPFKELPPEEEEAKLDEPAEVPQIDEIDVEGELKERMAKFDAETRELLLSSARTKVAEIDLEGAKLRLQLALLQDEIEKALQQFEDEMLLLAIV